MPAMLDGDYARAYQHSRTARRLGIIALCISVGLFVLFFAFVIIAGSNGAFDCDQSDPNC